MTCSTLKFFASYMVRSIERSEGMDDRSIIELYWARNEQAIKETDKKYGKLCFQLADNILKRKDDTEECVNDTFMKIWDSIPNDRPAHFAAYICQIVKRLAITKYRYNHAEKRNKENAVPYDELSEIVSGKDNPEDNIIMSELSQTISSFLSGEKKQNRIIFVRRYWYYDNIDKIAEAMNLSSGTVRSTLSRMRKRLKNYLQKEGYDL